MHVGDGACRDDDAEDEEGVEDGQSFCGSASYTWIEKSVILKAPSRRECRSSTLYLSSSGTRIDLTAVSRAVIRLLNVLSSRMSSVMLVCSFVSVRIRLIASAVFSSGPKGGNRSAELGMDCMFVLCMFGDLK